MTAPYKDIRVELFKRWPNAAFGPGHVCLEDENLDQYQPAIDMINLVLARRSMIAFHWNPEDADDMLMLWDIHAFKVCENCDWYSEHPTRELADTLYALELVRWHEQGNDPNTLPN